MRALKYFCIFNFCISIFCIIAFYDFISQLCKFPAWILIFVCALFIFILVKSSINNINTTEYFGKSAILEMEQKNKPLFSYINTGIELSNILSLWLIPIIHLGINCIFIYAFFAH